MSNMFKYNISVETGNLLAKQLASDLSCPSCKAFCNSLNLIGADFEPIELLPLPDWSGYIKNALIAELRVRNAVQTEKYK
jgi:hypothetical protein